MAHDSDTLRPQGMGGRVEEECGCAQLGFVARALEQRCNRSQLLPWGGNESYSRPPWVGHVSLGSVWDWGPLRERVGARRCAQPSWTATSLTSVNDRAANHPDQFDVLGRCQIYSTVVCDTQIRPALTPRVCDPSVTDSSKLLRLPTVIFTASVTLLPATATSRHNGAVTAKRGRLSFFPVLFERIDRVTCALAKQKHCWFVRRARLFGVRHRELDCNRIINHISCLRVHEKLLPLAQKHARWKQRVCECLTGLVIWETRAREQRCPRKSVMWCVSITSWT